MSHSKNIVNNLIKLLKAFNNLPPLVRASRSPCWRKRRACASAVRKRAKGKNKKELKEYYKTK